MSESDHYRTLGVASSASKDEIKAAFRRLAVQFHPDKHSHSSPSARDSATLKFKQLSLAYEVLSDDRKRAAYNLTRPTPTYTNTYGNGNGNGNHYYARGRSYAGGYYRAANYNTDYSYPRHSEPPASKRWVSNLDAAMRYMTTREFLRGVVFASLLLAGTVAIDMSGDALWKMHNTGKSFEDVMKSVHNNSTSDRDKE